MGLKTTFCKSKVYKVIVALAINFLFSFTPTMMNSTEHTSNTRTVENENIDRISSKISLFFTLLNHFANYNALIVKNATKEEIKENILKMFLNNHSDVTYDLWKDTEMNEPYEINSYLNEIQYQYNNEIYINPKNIFIPDCQSSNDKGNSFAFAIVDKVLKYKGQSKTVRLFFTFDISSDFKIVQIELTNTALDDKCLENSNDVKNNCETDLVNAEKAYISKKFTTAKTLFQNAQKCFSQDRRIKDRLENCIKGINCDELYALGEKYMSETKWHDAKKVFGSVAQNCPNFSINCKEKVAICDLQLAFQNYEYYKQIGDNYFQRKYFKTAKEHYEDALKYKPQDSYLVSQIKQCKFSDIEEVKKEIQKAVRLAKKGNDNTIAAFKIMYEYEATNQLNLDNYFFMGMTVNLEKEISIVMGFDEYDRNRLALKYFTIAKKLGHPNADYMIEDVLSKKNKRNTTRKR